MERRDRVSGVLDCTCLHLLSYTDTKEKQQQMYMMGGLLYSARESNKKHWVTLGGPGMVGKVLCSELRELRQLRG